MIELIQLFRDSNSPEQFVPALFDSQTCERIFRTFRSMGSTQFTKINFSLLELIHMIGRVEVENEIKYCKLNIDGIELPHKRRVKTKFYELPTDSEIHTTITKAKDEAYESAKSFNMTNFLSSSNQIDNYQFHSKLNLDCTDELSYEDEDENEYEDDYDDVAANEGELNNNELNETYENESTNESYIDDMEIDPLESLNPNSPLVYVIDSKGETKKIRKSTFLWMITVPGIKMSNDRTRRFKMNASSKRKHTEN